MKENHNTDPLGAADEEARAQWEDGEGKDVTTTAGIWHAAIAYERARAAAAEGIKAAPELAGTFPVVLYFASDDDRGQFLQVVHMAKPGLVARKL